MVTTNRSSLIMGMNDDFNMTEMLRNISQYFKSEIRYLSRPVGTVDNTLSQKAKGLEDDFNSQKVKLSIQH